MEFNGLLANLVIGLKADAVIRGLRNLSDLETEIDQQYWNEDLGMTVPIFYVVCSREHRHVSSASIRALNKYKRIQGSTGLQGSIIVEENPIVVNTIPYLTPKD